MRAVYVLAMSSSVSLFCVQSVLSTPLLLDEYDCDRTVRREPGDVLVHTLRTLVSVSGESISNE